MFPTLRDGWDHTEWTGAAKQMLTWAFAQHGAYVYVDAAGGTGFAYAIFTASLRSSVMSLLWCSFQAPVSYMKHVTAIVMDAS